MTLDTPTVHFLQWSSCAYRRLVTCPKYPHFIITIPSHELGQWTGLNSCTYRRKKKERSTSKHWPVIEQTKWRPAWGILSTTNAKKTTETSSEVIANNDSETSTTRTPHRWRKDNIREPCREKKVTSGPGSITANSDGTSDKGTRHLAPERTNIHAKTISIQVQTILSTYNLRFTKVLVLKFCWPCTSVYLSQ